MSELFLAVARRSAYSLQAVDCGTHEDIICSWKLPEPRVFTHRSCAGAIIQCRKGSISLQTTKVKPYLIYTTRPDRWQQRRKPLEDITSIQPSKRAKAAVAPPIVFNITKYYRIQTGMPSHIPPKARRDSSKPNSTLPEPLSC